MRRALPILAFAALACGGGDPENNPICGFASIAGAAMVLEELRAGTKVLYDVPQGVAGAVPARVPGHGTARAVAEPRRDSLVVQYEGPGFPTRPGFGLLLVEDSLDTFKGVLIYDIEPLVNFPQLGTVTDHRTTIPLYGTRISWGLVSDQRCPLFKQQKG